ncbi:hypothetical protein [Acinetobacter sp. Marseille-Q1623]|uniref:hypothetical protein n=1 Tax=Acinetobacter sp. Marseille-Q1623 TaxID=2697501 RepID=UPI00157B705D|nr:hypothetical protein [Acinetobacter sp. Marseille-Q1623]
MNIDHLIFKLSHLDRYGADVEEFIALINALPQALCPKVIDALFHTFSQEDDFGIQETVLARLDTISDDEFAHALNRNFNYLLTACSEQEWLLLIIGRYVNAQHSARLNAILKIADKNPQILLFLTSDYFVNEYPEIKRYFLDKF